MGAVMSRSEFIRRWITGDVGGALGRADQIAAIEDLDSMIVHSGGTLKAADEPTKEERSRGVKTLDEEDAARDAECKLPGSYMGRMKVA